jgi:hypothetical protein
VQYANVAEVAVAARFAGDTIHLLAELLENAASFSPPDTPVRVETHHSARGLVITVADRGIGMPPEVLADANNRLANPTGLNSSLVGTMGLHVVARLANRHGIVVRLGSAPGLGTNATVVLPDPLLTAPLPDALSTTPAWTGATWTHGQPPPGYGPRGAVAIPDPEDIRARLSSLAAGIAAAEQTSIQPRFRPPNYS